MFDKIREIINRILNLNKTLDNYKKEAVVEALPSLAYVNRAKKCIDRGEFDKAKKILEEAMELPQEDALVYKYLGIVCDKTGRLAEAITAFKKSANINDADKEIWRFLGFALMNSNKCEEAIESFENANKINPANTDVFAGWGMALMKLKRYNEAHEKFMESVRLNRYNFMALLLAAIMEVRTGQYNEAEAKLNFLANVNPNETNTYEYANLKYIKKDYDSAIHYAKKALEFNPNMLPVYLLLGKLYAIKGDKKASLTAYETAKERKLESPHLYFDWAITMQMYENYEQAKLYFLKALSFAPGEEEANAGLALTEACLGNIDEAELLIKNIKSLNDENYLYAKATAVIAMYRNDFNTAITKLKNIQDKMFFDNTINLFIAVCYDELKDINNAKEYYENALLSAGDNLKVYLKYADFLIKHNDYESAQRKLNRALKLNENNIDVLNKLFHVGYILVKEKDSEYNMKETLAIADKIISIDNEAFLYPEEREDLENILKNR
ncbi:tetratricopeptide repeat protein [bacterium]|nr:tetratricopeptide repeat protein [bacterium]